MTKENHLFKTILLILFLLCLIPESHATSYDSVNKYYQHKYLAENAIMDADYPHAVKEYKIAYQYKTPNGVDLHNSFKVAYICRDSAMAKSWHDTGILHGWTKSGFEETEYGKSIKNDGLYQWINSNYDSLHRIALNSNMPKVARIMDSVLHADQAVRPILNRPITEKETQSMVHADSINIVFLKRYMEQNGYPDFEKVGVFEEFNYPSTIWFVLYHTRYISKELNKLCFQAVLEGKMPPGEYASIVDMQENAPAYFEQPKWDKNGNIPIPLTGTERAAINELRAKLFLEPIEDYHKKLLFQKDKNHPFFEFIPFMIISYPF